MGATTRLEQPQFYLPEKLLMLTKVELQQLERVVPTDTQRIDEIT
jgi:hypothetical protein